MKKVVAVLLLLVTLIGSSVSAQQAPISHKWLDIGATPYNPKNKLDLDLKAVDEFVRQGELTKTEGQEFKVLMRAGKFEKIELQRGRFCRAALLLGNRIVKPIELAWRNYPAADARLYKIASGLELPIVVQCGNPLICDPLPIKKAESPPADPLTLIEMPAPLPAPPPIIAIPPETPAPQPQVKQVFPGSIAGCRSGFTLIANAWSLSSLPDGLRKKAEDLIAAAEKRDSRNATDVEAYKPEDLSRSIGGQLRREVRIRAPVNAEVRVQLRDPQTMQVLEELPSIHLANGIGSISLSSDQRAKIVETIWPANFVSPTISGGAERRNMLLPTELADKCEGNVHGALP